MVTKKQIYADNKSYKLLLEFAQDKGGEVYLFLHLDVYKWNVKVLRVLREELKYILNQAYLKGIDCVSFSLPKNHTTKFHNMIKELDYEEEMVGNKDYIVGGWFSEAQNGY